MSYSLVRPYPPNVWRACATDRVATLADHGLRERRALAQMTIDLPLAAPEVERLATRPFEPATDADEWLEVNNAAFAWHPEQAAWTPADLAERMAEPWFRADDFLLHHRDGRLAAFCWTKRHEVVEPRFGEIYVVAVAPDATGLGLGRSMTVTALDHLHRAGFDRGMLYVEIDNEPAIGLYRALGFTVAATNRCFTGAVRGSGSVDEPGGTAAP